MTVLPGCDITSVVITHAHDFTVDPVIDRMMDQGTRVLRGDLHDYSVEASFSGGRWQGSITDGATEAPLSNVYSVWWRKPTVRQPSGIQPVDGPTWAAIESEHAVIGLLRPPPILNGSSNVLWVNDPSDNARASYKAEQLVWASKLGMAVPSTHLIPDGHQLKETIADGQWIMKPLRGQPVVLPGEPSGRMVYARQLRPDDLSAGEVSYPVQVQTIIDKAYDVRVVCVQGKLFAHAPNGNAPLDWRRHQANMTWRSIDIPSELIWPIRKLVYNSYNLMFATLDFSVDRYGTWWFLEINPNGNWLWEHPHREDITAELTRVLGRRPSRGALGEYW